mgnify:CR=1 FL=1
MSNEREREAMLRARAFIDRLTVDAPDGDPKAIVEDENRFFAWDNEHRSPKTGKTFLFDWSYYIGIVMEGLYYMYEAGAGTRYRDYAKRYLHAVETGGPPEPIRGLHARSRRGLLQDRQPAALLHGRGRGAEKPGRRAV